MTGSISALKKHSLLPGMALLISSLILTGEVFNCCRINEAFAEQIELLIKPSSQPIVGLGIQVPQEQSDADHDSPSERHHHCLGHGMQTENASSDPCIIETQSDGMATLVPTGEQCISEWSLKGKTMVTSVLPQFIPPMPAVGTVADRVPMLTIHFARPRPQNKSSPPLFLTTLRILV